MTKPKPSSRVASRLERAAALKTLLTLMVAQTRAQSVTPNLAKHLEDPTKLARESAASAISIAKDCAALGMPGKDNQQLAHNLWTETLAQIRRIKALYFPDASMPFLDQPPPPGPANDI